MPTRETIDLEQHGRGEARAQFKFLTDWLFQYGAEPAFGTHDGQLIDYAHAARFRADKDKNSSSSFSTASGATCSAGAG